MPAITFDRFDGGLDTRQLASSADANRLRVLENAYVTTGRTIKKRPGLKKYTTLPDGTKGLFSGLGKLWVFSGENKLIPYFNVLKVENAENIKRIVSCEVFNGYIYAVIMHKGADIRHFYFDGKRSEVGALSDSNVTHSISIAKKASKMWSIKDDVVRFSATNDASDWSKAEDAGFLPVALQQSVSNRPTALGEFQNNLVVFFEDSTQIWRVDPNPKNHALIDTIPTGTKYPYAHANMSSDIFFLSPSGFRSIAVQAYTTNLMDNDIGSPIDSLVKVDLTDKNLNPRMVYWRSVGQLVCFMGDYAYVYSFSRSSKISAWSIWNFPFIIEDITEHDNKLFVRSGNDIYYFDEKTYTDDSIEFSVVAELPFLDCKMPGTLKQFTGVDVAAEGSMKLSFKFNPMRPDDSTIPLSISGDTRPLPRIPVEVNATNLAVRVENTSGAPFELAAITVYFEKLSGFAT